MLYHIGYHHEKSGIEDDNVMLTSLRELGFVGEQSFEVSLTTQFYKSSNAQINFYNGFGQK